MGKIKDKVNKFLLRLANRLGIKKDNLLDAAKEDKKKDEPLLRSVKDYEKKISDHEKFVQQVKEDALKFNPNVMSKEEAIIKILEEKGMSTGLSKNSAARKQISQICTEILGKNEINRITKDNLEEVKELFGNSGIEISEDGNLLYTETKLNNIGKIEEQNINTFLINDNDEFEKIHRNERNWSVANTGDTIKYYSSYTREQQIYNKYGLEMKKVYDDGLYNREENYNGLPHRESGLSYTIDRNSDLVSATYKRQEVPNSIINDEYIDYSNQGETVQYEIACIGQYDKNELSGYGIYPSFENDKKEMKKNNERNGSIYSISRKDMLNKSAKESNAIRKTAEENGLIEKEEELEQ